MLNFDPNQVVIYTLVFLLGLLIGGFLFTGGGRKWKARYNAEVDRRKEIEARHVAAEKDWREQDSLRGAAAKDRVVEDRRVEERRVEDRRVEERRIEERNRDGVADRDGIDDRDQAPAAKIDRDRDGVDDRREV